MSPRRVLRKDGERKHPERSAPTATQQNESIGRRRSGSPMAQWIVHSILGAPGLPLLLLQALYRDSGRVRAASPALTLAAPAPSLAAARPSRSLPEQVPADRSQFLSWLPARIPPAFRS